MVWGFCWINLEICQIQNLTPDQIIISPCNSISIKSVSDAVCLWRGPKMFKKVTKSLEKACKYVLTPSLLVAGYQITSLSTSVCSSPSTPPGRYWRIRYCLRVDVSYFLETSARRQIKYGIQLLKLYQFSRRRYLVTEWFVTCVHAYNRRQTNVNVNLSKQFLTLQLLSWYIVWQKRQGYMLWSWLVSWPLMLLKIL